MANWSNPINTSANLDVLAQLKSRDIDAATLFKDTPSNTPEGAIRFTRESGDKFKVEEYSGSVWEILSIHEDSGGFSGSILGTMSSQDSDNVSITGGSVASSTLSGNIDEVIIPDISANKIASDTLDRNRLPLIHWSGLQNTFDALSDSDKINGVLYVIYE